MAYRIVIETGDRVTLANATAIYDHIIQIIAEKVGCSAIKEVSLTTTEKSWEPLLEYRQGLKFDSAVEEHNREAEANHKAMMEKAYRNAAGASAIDSIKVDEDAKH